MKKLFVALLALTTSVAAAQSHSVNLSNRSARIQRSYFADDEDLPARNHGTGIRVGAGWALARAAAHGQHVQGIVEVGVFHQLALNRAVSVQGEALYYRDATAGGRSSGFRLPALLVINPFYNVSFHVGPQLQVRTGGVAARLPAEADLAGAAAAAGAAPRLTGSLVVGGEARAGFLRFGVRYGMPFNTLMDLQAAGKQLGAAWQTGQVQVYVGAGF